jgi:hypothetical protein
MKRLAFLGVTIATLIAPIQGQAQQYDPVANCIRFPQIPNPGAELQFMLSHPNMRVCPSENSSLTGPTVPDWSQGPRNTLDLMDTWRR